eukprot:2873674-Amphidinium_carterae.2
MKFDLNSVCASIVKRAGAAVEREGAETSCQPGPLDSGLLMTATAPCCYSAVRCRQLVKAFAVVLPSQPRHSLLQKLLVGALVPNPSSRVRCWCFFASRTWETMAATRVHLTLCGAPCLHAQSK